MVAVKVPFRRVICPLTHGPQALQLSATSERIMIMISEISKVNEFSILESKKLGQVIKEEIGSNAERPKKKLGSYGETIRTNKKSRTLYLKMTNTYTCR